MTTSTRSAKKSKAQFTGSEVPCDHAAVSEFLGIIHAQAAKVATGIEDPGLLQLYTIDTTEDENLSVHRYAIGDVEGMVSKAIASAEKGLNTYVEGRTVRSDLRGNVRGKNEDTRLVFALIVENDADRDLATDQKIEASVVVESSRGTGNTHQWIFLDCPLPLAPAHEIGARIRAAAKADADTGKIAQGYRVAGTPNFPTEKKRAKGRVVTPTSILFRSDRRFSPDELGATFPEKVKAQSKRDDDIEINEEEFITIASAVAACPNCPPLEAKVFYEITCALKFAADNAESPNLEDKIEDLWDSWARDGKPAYRKGRLWKSLKGNTSDPITLGTLYWYAAQEGWDRNKADWEYLKQSARDIRKNEEFLDAMPWSEFCQMYGMTPDDPDIRIRKDLGWRPTKLNWGGYDNDEPQPSTKADDEFNETIAKLAALQLHEYDRVRKDEAVKLNIRLTTLDAYVEAARIAARGDDAPDGKQGTRVKLHAPEPWDEPVDGAVLLEDICKDIETYVILDIKSSVSAIALWTVAEHAIMAFQNFPYLFLKSPIHQCGKTTLMDAVGPMTCKPIVAEHATVAALFRLIERERPTLLLDEVDSFIKDNVEMRGVLNSGHRKGGQVLRVVGEDLEPRAFSTYCPKVLAAIGKLPATIEDRCIIIGLKRKKKNEVTTRFLSKYAEGLRELARKCSRFAADNFSVLADADPELPKELSNRNADNWIPLLAVADIVGGEWPKIARDAAIAICGGTVDVSDTWSLLLLSDAREYFKINPKKEYVSSAEFVTYLGGLEARPWGTINRGRCIDDTRLMRFLKPFGIITRNTRLRDDKGEQLKDANGKDVVAKRFSKKDFVDAWRYLDSEHDLGDEAEAEPISEAKLNLYQKPKLNLTILSLI